MKKTILIALLVASNAMAGGPINGYRGPFGGFRGPVSYPGYVSTVNHSLVGYGSSAQSYPMSRVGPITPDAEWTPMFSPKPSQPTVQGVNIVTMKGSAKGSFIYVSPGGREYNSVVRDDLPPPNTIYWSKKP